MNIITDRQLGYLAGLFDGEGCIGFYRRGMRKGVQYYTAQLSITSTEPSVMNKIIRLVGYGKVTMRPAKAARKAAYTWTICNKPQIREFLSAIRPELDIKAAQVDLLFNLWRQEDTLPLGYRVTPAMVETRRILSERMKELKRETSLH